MDMSMVGWIDGQVDGQMERPMYGCTHSYISLVLGMRI
jgi:hypothetical protein